MIDEATVEQWMRDANPIPTFDDVDADEFARFVAAAHTRRAAVMQAPTQRPAPATPITPPPQRRRKAWAFAAAFVLVVAAVGIAALVMRGGGEAPVADEPVAPVTVTTPPPRTSVPPPIDVQSLTWSRVPHDDTVFDPTTTGEDVMLDITAGGPGFVAVGWNSNDYDSDALAWISEDGITWSLVTSVEPNTIAGPYPMKKDPLRTGLAPQIMESVTVGGPGLVAVGTDWGVEGLFSGAAVWTSEDGISWSKAIVDSESAWMRDVTAGGPGLVAVGSVVEEPPLGFPWVGAIWTSVDGITWNRAPQDLRGLEGMASVTVGGPGLVAVGTLEDEGSAVVWTSPDGLTWTRVPHDEALFGGAEMSDVVAGGPGLVAVGSDEGAAVWTSPDGSTWTRVPHDPEVFGVESMHAVTSVGSQLVAVGGHQDREGSVVWTSDDGVTWTRSDIPGAGTVHSVAASDTSLIAVGEDGGAAAVWVATEG